MIGASYAVGRLYERGARVVVAGRPNAGKSSLFNLLVREERSIVAPEPGTTRDFIEERAVFGPHCLRLIDTAGLNPAPGPVERLGIAKTRECIDEADIIVLVLDAGRPTPPLPPEIAARLSPSSTVVALNKTDLLRGLPVAVPPAGLRAVALSALTGAGAPELAAELIRRADGLAPGDDEDSVAINARHAHALAEAGDCLRQAIGKLDTGAPSELLASDLRGALNAMGEILGKIDNEQVLDRLFATFCIGK